VVGEVSISILWELIRKLLIFAIFFILDDRYPDSRDEMKKNALSGVLEISIHKILHIKNTLKVVSRLQ